MDPDSETTYNLFFKKDNKPFLLFTRWVLIGIKVLLILILLFTRPAFYIPIIFFILILSVLEYRAIHLIPSVDLSSHLVFNGLIKKKYAWSEIEFMVLKDGLLSIHFKSNRLFQKEITNELKEAEFNDWCLKKYTN